MKRNLFKVLYILPLCVVMAVMSFGCRADSRVGNGEEWDAVMDRTIEELTKQEPNWVLKAEHKTYYDYGERGNESTIVNYSYSFVNNMAERQYYAKKIGEEQYRYIFEDYFSIENDAEYRYSYNPDLDKYIRETVGYHYDLFGWPARWASAFQSLKGEFDSFKFNKGRYSVKKNSLDRIDNVFIYYSGVGNLTNINVKIAKGKVSVLAYRHVDYWSDDTFFEYENSIKFTYGGVKIELPTEWVEV